MRMAYFFFWLLPVVLMIVGETEGDWVGLYADDPLFSYGWEGSSILLAFLCVPLALKLLPWMLKRKIDRLSLPKALRLYGRWGVMQLFLLELPVVVGMLVYYLMMSNTGILCSLIALAASLFCVPGEKRLRRDLHIE